MKKVTLEELILELSPFSEELATWCKTHSQFLNALKVVHPERFISPAMIMTSTSPNYPNDQVIGVYAYDVYLNKPIFKQDFIINKGKLSTEFILYTRNPGGSSRYVKDIKEFYATYGKGGYYLNSHHLTREQIPTELQGRVQETIDLAERIGEIDPSKIDQEHIERIHKEVTKIKRADRYVIQKINV